MHMSLLLSLVLALACFHLTSSTCTTLPIKLPPRVVVSSSESCPSDEEKGEILTQLNDDLDSIIDDQLELFQNLSFPVVCPGGGWIKVADFNLEENSEAECPGGWEKAVSDGIPYCKLAGTEPCLSSVYPTNPISYSQVCGRVKSYQIGRTTAFFPYTIDQDFDVAYVDGVSITRGTPREHIWSFAAGYFSSSGNDGFHCPCIDNNEEFIPPFVGNDYFCDSGTTENPSFNTFYSDNPLWDGAGCEAGNGCCARGPYFFADLGEPSCDPLEARLCLSVKGDIDRLKVNVGVTIIELYVK